MARNPNVDRQSFMNGLLTQVEPPVLRLSLIHSQANEFPKFYEEVLKFFLCSYLREMGFSALTKRNIETVWLKSIQCV